MYAAKSAIVSRSSLRETYARARRISSRSAGAQGISNGDPRIPRSRGAPIKNAEYVDRATISWQKKFLECCPRRDRREFARLADLADHAATRNGKKSSPESPVSFRISLVGSIYVPSTSSVLLAARSQFCLSFFHISVMTR